MSADTPRAQLSREGEPLTWAQMLSDPLGYSAERFDDGPTPQGPVAEWLAQPKAAPLSKLREQLAATLMHGQLQRGGATFGNGKAKPHGQCHFDEGNALVLVLDGLKVFDCLPPPHLAPVGRSNTRADVNRNIGSTAAHPNCPWVRATVIAGDILYLPKGWWHSVRSDAHSVGITQWYDRPVAVSMRHGRADGLETSTLTLGAATALDAILEAATPYIPASAGRTAEEYLFSSPGYDKNFLGEPASNAIRNPSPWLAAVLNAAAALEAPVLEHARYIVGKQLRICSTTLILAGDASSRGSHTDAGRYDVVVIIAISGVTSYSFTNTAAAVAPFAIQPPIALILRRGEVVTFAGHARWEAKHSVLTRQAAVRLMFRLVAQ